MGSKREKPILIFMNSVQISNLIHSIQKDPKWAISREQPIISEIYTLGGYPSRTPAPKKVFTNEPYVFNDLTSFQPLDLQTIVPTTSPSSQTRRRIPKPQFPPVGAINRANYCYANTLIQLLAASGSWGKFYQAANPALQKIMEKYEASVKEGFPCNVGPDLAKILWTSDQSHKQQDLAEALQNLVIKCCDPSTQQVVIQTSTVSVTPYTMPPSEIEELQKHVKTISIAEKTQRSIEEINPDNVVLNEQAKRVLLSQSWGTDTLGSFFLKKEITSSFPLLTAPIRTNDQRPLIEHLLSIHQGQYEFSTESQIADIPCCDSNQRLSFKGNPPNILVLNLNRSNCDNTIARGTLTLPEDTHTTVPFPGCFFNQPSDVPYELTGFGCHLGDNSATHGHYVAYVTRMGENGKPNYFFVDDSIVRPISEERFISAFQTCSVAFFRKKGSLNDELPFVRQLHDATKSPIPANEPTPHTSFFPNHVPLPFTLIHTIQSIVARFLKFPFQMPKSFTRWRPF